MPDRERSHTEKMAAKEESRAERVEETLEAVEATVGHASYPSNTDELRAVYADRENELPNETESLADVFDRLADDEYETEAEAREAILGELTGPAGEEHGDISEYNSERELEELAAEKRDEEP
ncbi:DUF5789 family protein [Halocalculus aciditolerans]|uniref:DUF2795 domain-containing protein n=1 Tax=Halocalculus aciditolerans TaxID=1383812 RepID=A0A830FQ62_9EURY|nr:hypothetical protein [Halocalculus aciditolerans]GGL69592.1 hypothetical protein GCM10009039_29430 [Halocalculus aciditolerans]